MPGYTGFSSYVHRVMPGLPGLRLLVGANNRAICRQDGCLPEGPPTTRRLALLHQLALTQHGVNSKAALRNAGLEISDLQVIYSPYCDALLGWRGVPQVITCHDLTPLFYPNSRRAVLRYRLWTPLHLKKATSVIAISRFVADQLVEFGVSSSKIEVISNGIQIERDRIKAPASNDLVMLARHDQNKNVLFMVRAFGRILELQPNWGGRLVIVGRSGRETQSLLCLIKQLPQPDKVLLISGLEGGQLLRLLRGSLALVSASRMEGFDYPVLEAKAEGLPTLLSNIPVHQEFHGNSSEFFAIDKQPCNLAEVAIRLANDYQYWLELSIAGYEMCSSYALEGQRASILQLLSRY